MSRDASPIPNRSCLPVASSTVPVAHTLYIGDHRRDIEAGRAAGALTMAAAYGYVHPADPAEQWQADHLVRSVDEMASWLRQRLSAD
jgi:phosphoglycolate phosphatase-like HAD superfamily hydrolase